jgi:hypothetical protein
MLGKENSKYRGPEKRVCLLCWRNSEKTGEAQLERIEEGLNIHSCLT